MVALFTTCSLRKEQKMKVFSEDFHFSKYRVFPAKYTLLYGYSEPAFALQSYPKVLQDLPQITFRSEIHSIMY